MKYYFFSLLFCFFLSFTAFAQNPEVPDLSARITPPSPTAAALGKYGDIPVSLYTGVPNISIPLYEFRSKKLTVPISVSYHASGVKVDEVASNVGLGWSLNAGGAITRTVRGLPDDGPNGFQSLPSNFASDINLQNDAAQGTRDTEPDQFFFNVGGYSGKFVFDNDNFGDTIHIIPHQDIKVEQTSSTTWKLTAPDGTIYEFGGPGKYEEVKSSSVDCESPSSAPFQKYITSWFLSKIIHTDGDYIDFLYTANPYSGYVSGMSETKYVTTSPGSVCNACQSPPSGGLPIECAQLSEIETGVRLTKIQASTGSVDFIYSSDRIDLAGAYKLTKIEARGQLAGILREFEFSYDYFTSTGATSFNYAQYGTVWADPNSFFKRLKLLSIQEKSGGDTKPPYSFNYLDELGGDYVLPPRLSVKQDYWGYANDNDVLTFIPENNSIAAFANGADRSPHPEKTKAGMLYRITYPTGGYTQMDYEAHDYGSLEDPDELICNQTTAPDSEYGNILLEDTIRTVIKPFSVNVDQFVDVQSKAYNTGVEGDLIGLAEIRNEQGWLVFSAAISETLVPSLLWLEAGDYTIELIDLHPTEYAQIIVSWENIVTDCDPVNAISAQTSGGVRIKRLRKSDGTQETIQRYEYVRETDSTRSSGVLISGPVYFFNQHEYRPPSAECFRTTACGTICTFIGATSSSKAPLGVTQGSHIGYTHVKMYHGENGEAGLTANTYSFAPDEGIQQYPFGPLTSYDWKRGHLLKQVDYKVNGQEVRRLENTYTYDANSEEFEAEESIFFSIATTKTKTFTVNTAQNATIWANAWHALPNNNFQGTAVIKNSSGSVVFTAPASEELVQSTLFLSPDTYTIELSVANVYEQTKIKVQWVENSTTLVIPRIRAYRVGYTVQNPICFPATVSVIPYDIIVPWVRMSSSTETIDGVAKTTNYEYNGNGLEHTNPIAVSFNNSDGEVFRTETEYAHEIGDACMLSKHMIGIPIKVTRKKGSTVVGGHRTEFINCRPRKVYEILQGNTELLRGEISGYTADGYPNDYKRMGFNKEEYFWTDGLLTKKKWNDWEWNYSYYGNSRLLDTLTEIDGQFTKYQYDNFQRLEQIEARLGNITSNITYELGGPNRITTTTTYSDAPTQTLIDEFDGLGRPIRNIHNGVTKNEIVYDNLDRIDHQTYLPGNFTYFDYDDSPLDRVISEVYPDGSSIQMDYGNQGNYYQTIRYDEKGNPTTTLTEIVGRVYQIKDALNGTTTYDYDIRDNLESVSPPSGNPYVYKYDIRNRMEEKTIPGADTQFFYYDDTNDLLDYSIDGNSNRLDYEYDIYGREINVRLAENVGVGGGSPGGIIISRVYGETLTGDFYHGKLMEEEAAVLGGSSNAKTTFIYDSFGRVDYQNELYPLGTGSSTDVVDFSYNHADWLLSETRDHNGHENLDIGVVYDYDNFGRMIARFAGASGTNSDALAIGMTYDDRDQMTSKRLGISGFFQSLDRINYSYTERGWVKKMNDVILKTSDIGLCENPTKPEEPVQEEEVITIDELLEYICTGEEIVIDDLDPCEQGDCIEELNTHRLYVPRHSCIYEIIGSGETMALADYPYCTTDDAAERAQLEAHIESWLTQQGFEFSDVLVTDLGRQGTLLEIKKTNFNLTGAVIGCEMTLSVRWDFPTLTEIFIDGSLVNLSGYPYCDLIDSPSERTRLINDFTAWLNTNGYYYQDVQIIDRGAVVILTVTQTNLVFDSGRTRNCCTPAECSTGMKEIDASVTNSICSYRIESTLDEIVPCTPTIVDNDNKGETIDNTGSNVIYEVLKSDGSTEWAYKQNLPLIQGDYRLGTRVFVTSPQMKLKVLQTDSTIVEMTADEFITAANTNPGPHPIEPGDGEPTSAECQFDSLGCTPLQIEEQQESISDIMAAMCNTPIESLSFPLTISLVRLCDGSTTYIVGDQFVNQIEGPHVVVDTLILNNPDDVINVLIVKKERLFSMSFSYEPNGNIKKMRWKITNNTVKYYDTSYDPLNRILNANYGQEYLSEVNGNTFITIDPNDAYRAFNFSYDAVGNLQSLSRYGMVPDGNCYSIQLIDQLTYTLDASKHQVTKIADGAPSAYKQYGFKPGDVRSGDHYDYDDNGNLISDEHKGLDISYNFLNLPKQITGSGTVDLTYDALGRKWKKVGTTGTFEYVGGLVYKDEKVEAYYDPDGRVVANYINGGATLDGFRAEYWHKDHLGNSRLAFSDVDRNGYITYEDDPNTPGNEMEIFQENHYYPFGMNQDGPWYQTVTPENRYQFNGIERNRDLRLDWDLAEFRSYDAAIGRWIQIDPIIKFNESPYAGFSNNPILFTDPLGLDTLKQIGPDFYDGGYFDVATVTANKTSNNSETSSNNSNWSSFLFANRFSRWKPTGTGAGLSVNPNFPQYSEYAEGIKDITWNMLSPILLSVGGGGAGSGGGRLILQRIKSQMDIIRISRAFKMVPQQSNRILSFTDELSKSGLLPLRQAPRGGILIGEKFYAGGQFLPGSRTVFYGRGYVHPEYLNLPALSNALRPSPIFHPSLSTTAKWTISGSALGFGVGRYYQFFQNNK